MSVPKEGDEKLRLSLPLQDWENDVWPKEIVSAMQKKTFI
jgi:hypothetical protein